MALRTKSISYNKVHAIHKPHGQTTKKHLIFGNLGIQKGALFNLVSLMSLHHLTSWVFWAVPLSISCQECPEVLTSLRGLGGATQHLLLRVQGE